MNELKAMEIFGYGMSLGEDGSDAAGDEAKALQSAAELHSGGADAAAEDGEEELGEDIAEEDAAILAAQLLARQETEARMTAEMDARIARSGILNPATGRPFRSMQELDAFGAAQREEAVQRIARYSGRSAAAVRAEIEQRESLRRLQAGEPVQRSAEQQFLQRTDALCRGMEELAEKHPEVDAGQLLRNENFRRFCGSRLGAESLTALYDDYEAIVGGAERAAGAESRKRRSTGSGGRGGERLSAKQRASLDAWNKANPDMKMTAREFLAR